MNRRIDVAWTGLAVGFLMCVTAAVGMATSDEAASAPCQPGEPMETMLTTVKVGTVPGLGLYEITSCARDIARRAAKIKHIAMAKGL